MFSYPIYINSSYNSTSKSQTTQFKNGQEELNTHFSKEAGGQQAHEKMLNITNYQENWNQNHMRHHFTPSERLLSKRTQITNAGKDVEKREPLYTIGGNVQPLRKTA